MCVSVCVCRLESVGSHALCDASWPSGPGQVQTTSTGDVGPEMAGPLFGGNNHILYLLMLKCTQTGITHNLENEWHILLSQKKKPHPWSPWSYPGKWLPLLASTWISIQQKQLNVAPVLSHSLRWVILSISSASKFPNMLLPANHICK